ncbi:MAG: YidC/Oxa1 family membrane protein insertase [Candidatus Moraniibacteriota bacterium]
MLSLFHTFISQPLYNALVFLYNVVPGGDFGIAIILTTILLKVLMLPLSKKQIESQKKMQELQPKMKEIQAKHRDNKEEQTKALMQLYKEEQTNPFSGCLPLLVQIVFLIAIYHVIIRISQAAFTINGSELYAFVENPGTVNHLFLHIVDLARPNILLAALAALAQYFQTKMMLQNIPTPVKKEGASKGEPDFAAIMNKQMLYIAPAITLFIGATFPAALSLYWLTSTLFMLFQQIVIFRKQS